MAPSGPELDPHPLGGHHRSHFEDRCDALRVLLDPYAQLQYIRNQLAACRDQPGPTTDLAELLLLLHLVDTTTTVRAVPAAPTTAPLHDASSSLALDAYVSLGSAFGTNTSGQADRPNGRGERSRQDQGPGADTDGGAGAGVHAIAGADVHAGPNADAAPDGDRGTRTGPRTDRATGAEEVPPQQEWVRTWTEWVHQNVRCSPCPL